jgi:hypothetical protein
MRNRSPGSQKRCPKPLFFRQLTKVFGLLTDLAKMIDAVDALAKPSKNKLTAIDLIQSLILLLAITPELALQEHSVYGSECFSNYDSKHSDLSLNDKG